MEMKIAEEKREGGQELHESLLRTLAEQNRERFLDYDAAEDVVTVCHVVSGRFVEDLRLDRYVSGRRFGGSLILEEDRPRYMKAFRACLKKPCCREIDIRCMLAGKRAEWYKLNLVSVDDGEPPVKRIAGIFVSIRREKRKEEKIRLRAEMDELTGLYYHRVFEEKCGHAIAACTTESAFLMLDVDDFKMINDSLGHAMGDSVLAQTGRILRTMVGDRGIAGRMGGDEFAAFVSGFSGSEEVAAFCRRLQNTLKTITFDIEYCASIGVCVSNGRRLTFQDMYYEADQALYAAKNSGKNQYVLYDRMDELQRTKEPEPERKKVSFEDADAPVVLALYDECIGKLKQESVSDGIECIEHILLNFFDADCIALVRWKEDQSMGIHECHKESAEMTARLLIDAVESGSGFSLRELLDGEGLLTISNVKEIKEQFPKHYDRLTGCRIWSVFGSELREGLYSEGVLFAVNPHKHIEDALVLRMLADDLVVRLMKQEMIEQQEYALTHDHLTGLWSRNSYVLYSNRGNEDDYNSLGIVTTDVVGLSHYNREFGYLNGSKRLVEAAAVLKSVFEGYRIFRYDEDEMLAFCPNVKKTDFMFLVRCLQEKAEDLSFPLAVGYSWSCHADAHSQLAESETVMGNDKQRLLHGTEVEKRVEQAVIDEVSQMIADGMYLVYLQPKVRVQDGQTVGAEALVRQMDRDIGLVSPGVFIPVLERYNIIHMVDLFVLEEVFKYQQAALREGRRAVPVSVNFSKLTIMQPDLIERVRELSQMYELPEGLIVIEITETVGDMDHIVVDHVADSLRSMGFALSMDDFGSHYSNLATLIQYDFDSAKIDRSMITDVATNHKSRIVINYMTSLINELGIKCIVEGIETKEQVDILKETKCDMIQGFYFGKPVPMENFYGKFMQNRQKD